MNRIQYEGGGHCVGRLELFSYPEQRKRSGLGNEYVALFRKTSVSLPTQKKA